MGFKYVGNLSYVRESMIKIHQIGIEGIKCFHDDKDFVLLSEIPLQGLNSALIPGERIGTTKILNHFVDKDIGPQQMVEEIQQVKKKYDLNSSSVIFLTAVKMEKHILQEFMIGPIKCVLMVTAGITNSAGPWDPIKEVYPIQSDLAESNPIQAQSQSPIEPGTINSILIIDAQLSPQIFPNLFIGITEAKCAVFQKYQIKTRFNTIATGTSTDAIGIFSTNRPPLVHWSGYATEFGQKIGQQYIQILETALKNGGYIK